MIRKILLPLLILCATLVAAQSTSKSKSKERFREKDDRRFPVRVDNLNTINLPGTDYAPAFYDNGIIFVSARAKRGPKDEATGEPFLDHYLSTFDALGKLIPPQKLEFNILKKSDFNEGSVCVSRDYQTAYISRNNNIDGVIKAGKDGRSTQKIYEVQYGFPDWTRPVELPFNSDDYSCLNPSLSLDGKWLYFASDMPGGYGGYDIYVVERMEEGWGTPRNLGSLVNTEKQEMFPFISFSNTLFFSSNGHEKNLGGMDIYYVNNPLEEDLEAQVVNMGEPFNSKYNDHSFIVDDSGNSGYFASDRPETGYGKDDIYQFFASSGIEGTGKPAVNAAKINVIDKKTGEPVKGAEIRILQPADNGFSDMVSSDFYSLDLVPRQDNPESFTLSLVRKSASEMGNPDLLTNVAGEALTEFTRYKQYLVIVSAEGYAPREQFLFVDTEEELDINFKLAEKPPCLRAGGIVLTTEFGTRIANATVKFVHRETFHSETVRTTWSGEFDACLSDPGDYIVYVERAGFQAENYRLTIGEGGDRAFQEIRLSPVEAAASAEAEMPLANGLSEGSVLVLDRVFYEYNKTTLNQSAIRYLDALLEVMNRYPNMEISLLAHTDTRGDADLNMILTEERAKNARIYLVYKGIDENRILASGLGETQPRNRCKEGVECSDEEHQQNNRLEIVVRKLE